MGYINVEVSLLSWFMIHSSNIFRVGSLVVFWYNRTAMRPSVFILLAFAFLSGCSQSERVTSTYHATQFGQGIDQKVDEQQRQKEYQLFLKMYQDAARRGDREYCRKLKEDYEKRLRQYELMDRLDQMDTGQGNIEYREDSSKSRVDAHGSVRPERK